MIIEKLVKKNFDLTPLMTFRIGGRAEFFMTIKNKQEFIKSIEWAKSKKLSITILSGGSNILVRRKIIKGLVLKISGDYSAINKNYLTCWAGANLTKLSNFFFVNGLTGLEWAFGMPGSLGGAVRGNAGAYGSDISALVLEVEAYDLIKNKLVKLSNKNCSFSYRNSIFKINKNFLIMVVKLKLIKGVKREIKILSQKNFKHRLENIPKGASAGCVFKNLEYKKVAEQNKGLAENLMAEGLVRGGKIGAGYLINQLGLKGKIIGGAKISDKHANFIINTGKAEAKDVISLINLVKKKVKHKYKIDLEEEIQYF